MTLQQFHQPTWIPLTQVIAESQLDNWAYGYTMSWKPEIYAYRHKTNGCYLHISKDGQCWQRTEEGYREISRLEAVALAEAPEAFTGSITEIEQCLQVRTEALNTLKASRDESLTGERELLDAERIIGALARLRQHLIKNPTDTLQHIATTEAGENWEPLELLARSYVAVDFRHGLLLTKSRGKRKTGRDPYYMLSGIGLNARFPAPDDETAITLARKRRDKQLSQTAGKEVGRRNVKTRS